MTTCGKCGSRDSYSGCFLGDGFFVYDYGCEDCDHFVTSDEKSDYGEAMDQAYMRFTKKVTE